MTFEEEIKEIITDVIEIQLTIVVSIDHFIGFGGEKIILEKNINVTTLPPLPFDFVQEYTGYKQSGKYYFAEKVIKYEMRIERNSYSKPNYRAICKSWDMVKRKEDIPDLVKHYRDRGFILEKHNEMQKLIDGFRELEVDK